MAIQITRETDYAIRCILYLIGMNGQVCTVGDISREQSIPYTFAAKIMQKLARAGLIESVRGVKGGFILKKRPEDISLLDVVEAIEGPISMNICVLDRRSCDRQPRCPVHPWWVEISEVLRERLGQFTFDKILK